jgi:tetratricopeptide (TPR) repeat protein
MAHYRDALECDPWLAEAHNNLGILLAEGGMFDHAAAHYRKALDSNPRFAEAHNNLGVALAGSDDIDGAEEAYLNALLANPGYAEAHNNLGSLYRTRGDDQRAAEHFRNALAIRPGYAEAHNNLGICLKSAGQLDLAFDHFQKAVAVSPNLAEGRMHLGSMLLARGAHEDAAEHFLAVLRITPDNFDALVNLGRCRLELGHADHALDHFRAAIELRDDPVTALAGAGLALRRLGRTDEAERHFRNALELKPSSVESLVGLGNLLVGVGRAEEAIALFLRAIEIKPNAPQPPNNLGLALGQLGRFDEAIAAFEQALEIAPDYADALNNLGNVQNAAGKFKLAERSYRRAIEIDPESPGAHQNFGMAQLLQGDFARGFDEYEWRWRSVEAPTRPLTQPLWRGEPLAGHGIVVWGEQGIGDEFMLGTVLPDVIAAADHCVFECEHRLVTLFRRSLPGATVIARGNPPAPEATARDVDLQAPLGSLCRWLRRGESEFAPPRAYLVADATKSDACRERYRALGDGLKVGIAWHSKTPRWGLVKSAPLAQWQAVLKVPGVDFFNLQYGDVGQEISAVEEALGVSIHQDREIDQMTDLDGFAAQIDALDLVISISNTTVHIAGALGKPVWTLLPQVPDWRWQLGRTDSLWYPRMRLFRQPAHGAWQPVLENVAAELSGRAAQSELAFSGRRDR